VPYLCVTATETAAPPASTSRIVEASIEASMCAAESAICVRVRGGSGGGAAVGAACCFVVVVAGASELCLCFCLCRCRRWSWSRSCRLLNDILELKELGERGLCEGGVSGMGMGTSRGLALPVTFGGTEGGASRGERRDTTLLPPTGP
jgi:hypothetical protein